MDLNMNNITTQNEKFLESQGKDIDFKILTHKWNEKSIPHKYAYNFTWLYKFHKIFMQYKN